MLKGEFYEARSQKPEARSQKPEVRKSLDTLTTAVKVVTGTAVLTVAACNSPVAPKQKPEPLAQLFPMEQLAPQTPIQTAPQDEFADWKPVAEFFVRTYPNWQTLGPELGWCPVYTRDGNWPNVHARDSIFIVLPGNERIIVGGAGPSMCTNGFVFSHPVYGYGAADECRPLQTNVSVVERPRIIPGMEF